MNPLIALSIVFRLAAAALAVAVMRRTRDWRLGILALLCALMALHQWLDTSRLAESSTHDSILVAHTTALVVSLIVFLAVFAIKRVIVGRHDTERELRESEQRFRTLSDLSPVAIFRIDAQGRCVFVNDRARTITARGVHELLGDGWLQMLHEEDRPRVESEWRQSFECHRAYHSEFRVRRPDGGVRWVLTQGLPQRLEDGTFFGFVGAVTDVTDLKKAGEILRRSKEELEQQVEQRTAYLLALNEELAGTLRTKARAEKALAESEQRLRAIIDNSSAVIYVKDFDGRYLLINNQWENALGMPRERVEGHTDHEVFPSDLADAFVANDRKVLETGEALEFDETAPHPDGLHEYISLKFPLRDMTGRVYAMCGISTDITQRRQTEQQLRESEERFRSVFDQGPLGMAITLANGRLARVNASFCRMLGYTAEELQGKHLADFTHPDDIERGKDDPNPATSRELRDYDVEKRYLTKDGRTLYVKVTVSLIDADTGPSYWLAMVEDITQRVRAEVELGRVFELSLDVMCTTGLDGRVKVVNPEFERTLGYRAEEIVGRPFRKLVDVADHRAVLAEFSHLRRGLDVSEFEARCVCRDGSVKWFSWKAIPVLDDDTIYAVGRDVTERKKTEDAVRAHLAQLAHVLRLHTMGEMASQISHELNQPLGAVVNYARGAIHRLAAAGVTDGDQVEVLHKIADQGIRGGALIRRIRDFVKKDQLRLEPVDLNRLITDAASLCMAGVDLPIDLRLELDSGLPGVHVDSMQIEQVVVNLIRNAIESLGAANNGTRVLRVTTARNDAGGLEVAVHDTGVGLSPGSADTIFEAFFTTKSEGLGMGLALSRSIVEAHGGRLWAAPAKDRGAVFRFTIPLQRAGAS